jgi:hypothetical protein
MRMSWPRLLAIRALRISSGVRIAVFRGAEHQVDVVPAGGAVFADDFALAHHGHVVAQVGFRQTRGGHSGFVRDDVDFRVGHLQGRHRPDLGRGHGLGEGAEQHAGGLNDPGRSSPETLTSTVRPWPRSVWKMPGWMLTPNMSGRELMMRFIKGISSRARVSLASVRTVPTRLNMSALT